MQIRLPYSFHFHAGNALILHLLDIYSGLVSMTGLTSVLAHDKLRIQSVKGEGRWWSLLPWMAMAYVAEWLWYSPSAEAPSGFGRRKLHGPIQTSEISIAWSRVSETLPSLFLMFCRKNFCKAKFLLFWGLVKTKPLWDFSVFRPSSFLPLSYRDRQADFQEGKIIILLKMYQN